MVEMYFHAWTAVVASRMVLPATLLSKLQHDQTLLLLRILVKAP